MIVEHPALPGWNLTGGGTPAENAGGMHRFRVAVDAKKTAVLTVDEVHPLDARVQVTDISEQQMALLLRGRTIDAATEEALREIARWTPATRSAKRSSRS